MEGGSAKERNGWLPVVRLFFGGGKGRGARAWAINKWIGTTPLDREGEGESCLHSVH